METPTVQVTKQMITYQEALDIINSTAVSPQETIELPTYKANGFVLAEDIVSAVSAPSFRNSAMDGFALRADDTNSAAPANPVSLKVIGSVSAGVQVSELPNINEREALEIMTGAPVPDTCNAVIPIEHIKKASNSAETIVIERSVKKQSNIRNEGEDITAGQVLVKSGSMLSAEQIALLVSGGVTSVRVKPKLKVAVISTGKELVESITESPKSLTPGEIYNSCAPYLLNALPQYGAQVSYHGIIADEPNQFLKLLETIVEDCDVLVTTGAVSQGRHDFIPAALRDFGAKILFHRIAIRPGKPILYGQITKGERKVACFGLPGNPLAAVVGLRFILTPYFRKCLGQEPETMNKARIHAPVSKPEKLKRFCLGFVDKSKVDQQFSIIEKQQSFMVSALQQSNAFAVLPEGKTEISSGEEVEWLSLYPDCS